MKKTYLLSFFTFLLIFTAAAQQSSLSVRKIMQDPKWMGTYPSQVQWSEDGQTIYFKYNLENDPADSLYKIEIRNAGAIVKVKPEEENNLIPSQALENREGTKKIYTKDGSLYLYENKKQKETLLLQLSERISQPQFLNEEELIAH